MGIIEKSGVGGLAVEQNDHTERGLDVHAPLDVETGLMDGSNVIYNSASTVTNDSPVEFLIPRDNECSFILNQTRLSGHFIVTTEDNKAIKETDPVTLCNHFSACLFSQVEVYLNGTQISDLSSSNSYPWKMFLQSLLSYNPTVKNSYLETEGFYSENLNELALETFDSINKEAYPSIFKRRKMITNKKKVYFNTRLGVDLFLTDKFLPPNVDIKIKLIRNKPRFGLLYNPTTGTGDTQVTKHYNIILKDLKLQMRKVLPTIQERDRYRAKIAREPCYLPYKASRTRQHNILKGITSCTVANVATGILPKTIIFVMITDQAGIHGPRDNPFYFNHFNLTSFNLKKNGQNIFPKTFQVDFSNDNYLDLYRHLYDSLGVLHGNHSFGLKMEHFKQGRTILAADLTPDQCNSYHVHPDILGNLDLELTFSQPIDTPVILWSYMIYNSGIKLDQFQQVIKGIQ